MVTISLDGDLLYAMLEHRLRLMEMASGDMNAVQLEDVLARLKSGLEVDGLVKRCVAIDEERIDQ